MKKHGLAQLGQSLGNLAAGKLKEFEFIRKKPVDWYLNEDSIWILENINILDVENGKLFSERAIIVNGKIFGKRLKPAEVKTFSKNPEIDAVIDGNDYYLVPGMSDLHCHPSLISEYELSLKNLHYFDAQRFKNCEFALSKGCTTIRDSAGAFDIVHRMKDEIEQGKLLGPRILPSYSVLTPPKGMWDINPIVNKMGEMIFGGKLINVSSNLEKIKKHMDLVIGQGAFSIKVYLEEKPLYGATEKTLYNMFDDKQIQFIRKYADTHEKVVESHAMFITGARKAIKGKVNSIAHMTVDGSYTKEDASLMVQNNVAIIPTLGVGSYLAMNCGERGYPEHEEYKFYRELLHKNVRPLMDEVPIPPLKDIYVSFYNFIDREIENRKMPGIGDVYPERCHGFAIYAPESFKNFKENGTSVGIGTDGGTGTGFTGAFEIEFEAMRHYGYKDREILRMVTLGNMEILKMDHKLGSIEEGKLADMLLIKENPLKDIMSMTSPVKVFKEGRCYIDNELT